MRILPIEYNRGEHSERTISKHTDRVIAPSRMLSMSIQLIRAPLWVCLSVAAVIYYSVLCRILRN